MVVPIAAASALAEDPLFARFDHLKERLAGLGVFNGRSDRYFQRNVRSVLSFAEVETSALTVLCPHHLPVAQMDERPFLRIRLENDVSAPSAVTAVRASLGYILRPVQVRRSRPSVPRCAEDLHVVYEIAFGHNGAKIRNFVRNSVIAKEKPLGGGAWGWEGFIVYSDSWWPPGPGRPCPGRGAP